LSLIGLGVVTTSFQLLVLGPLPRPPGLMLAGLRYGSIVSISASVNRMAAGTRRLDGCPSPWPSSPVLTIRPRKGGWPTA